MSNFLKNLARRSAGLPLAAECRPIPAPAFGGSFDSRAGVSEVTSESAVSDHIEAPPARQFQSLNAAATPEVQRSASEPIGTTTAATTANATRLVADIASGSSSPKNATTAVQPFSSLQAVSPDSEIGPADLRLSSPAASAQPQTTLSARRDSPATIDPSATASRRTEGNELAWPAISVPDAGEATQQKHELTTDHSIRPAPTDPTLPFQFPRTATSAPQPASPAPVEVRIGRVEVRGVPPAQQPTPATAPPSPPLGFASYHRLRRYRS